MFKTSILDNTDKYFKTGVFIGLLILLVSPVQTMALEAAESTCSEADVLPLNTGLRRGGLAVGESQYFKLEIPAAGLVTLDVSVPGLAEAEAKLDLVEDGCQKRPSPTDSPVIEQTADRLIMRVETPDAYIVAIAAQDPQARLGRYRLTTGFVTAEILDRKPFEWDFEKDGEEDEDELEIDPDLKKMPFNKDGEEDEDELEIDPDLRYSPSPGLPAFVEAPLSVSRQLCRHLALDDHGDTFACATRIDLRSRTTGTVLGSWGDDQDLFRFILTETRTVHLATTGPTDTFGVLFDSHGYRLATDDDSGEGDNFRLVKTLSPGLYFVRVEGSHAAEGSYTLITEARSW